MRYYPTFTLSTPNEPDRPAFPATVPGNAQADYLAAHPDFCPDLHYGMNHKKMTALEPYTWVYRTTLAYALSPGERLYFVTEGIDYQWSLSVDGKTLHRHEGMFSKVEIDLTFLAHPGSVLEITIEPHPMLHHRVMDRTQAAQCVKPPVSYEWDWHPRVIPSGIWDETYLETRKADFIRRAEPRYRLSDDYKTASLFFDVDCNGPVKITLIDPDGRLIYFGGRRRITVENPKLWWCNGQGKPNLYTYVVTSESDCKKGQIGFRTIRLAMNQGAWSEPAGFPKSRSVPPAQLVLNGRKIFAKGSNYVNHELFPGTLTRENYEAQVKAAAEANMNIFRCWGGSGIQKAAFYDLCDRYGILIWAEFPLACNDYYDSPKYLKTLEQEAVAIIEKLRPHACLALFCGGNELFNSWSGMTDQHHALRLLNKLTYDLCRDVPFLMTSPLSGMKHGGYTFIDGETGLDQFALFSRSKATAYTEFGIPGILSVERLKEIIPEKELFPIPADHGGSWKAHHAFEAWGKDAWLCLPTLEKYGDVSTLEALVETSQWLQYAGYKAIFEEARRQKPYCAMAINWCFGEPWKCAVNNSLLAYPAEKKSGWYAVRDSLRNVVGSAKMTRFDYREGESFTCELWLLNDSPETVAEAEVTLSLVIPMESAAAASTDAETTAPAREMKVYLGAEHFRDVPPLQNARGKTFRLTLPRGTKGKRFDVVVTARVGDEVIVNRYPMALAK